MIGLALIPIVRRIAIAVGLIDRPDAHRKIHGREIAYGGGVGVLLSVMIALSVFAFVSDTWWSKAGQRTTDFVGLSGAAILICLVGLIDDYRGISGKKKLLAQAAAAILVVVTGPAIVDLTFFGFPLHLGIFVYPVVVFWILASINAMNLIDGMDGLASSVGISIFASLAIIGLWSGHSVEAVTALAAAGALMAFLVYNFYPATIFLGDAGSMLLGLGAGTLLVRVTATPEGTIPVAIPIAVMVIPLFDTTAAIIRRKFTGRTIYTTDRGHIHHCFRRNGMNVRWTMSCIALLSVIAGLSAIAAAMGHSDFLAIGGAALVVGVLAGTKSFGHSEIVLLGRFAKMFLLSFVKSSSTSTGDHDLRHQLQGEGNWDELWDELKSTAQRMGLSRVRLDVNLPAMHEGYYAEWKSRSKKEDEAVWNAVVPLVVNGRSIGRVELAGDRSQNPSFQNWLTNVGELLEAVELRVATLVQGRVGADPKAVVVHLADAPNPLSPKLPSKLLESEAMSSAG